MNITPVEWQRLRKKINKDLSCGDCVWWTGATHGTGNQRHGNVGFRRRSWSAHRLFYTIFNGEIPTGMCVLHACNPRTHRGRCVQPLHLYIGTKTDNARDQLLWGTNVSPSGNKLTKATAREMRSRFHAGGISYRELADTYSITPCQAGKIVRGEQWKE